VDVFLLELFLHLEVTLERDVPLGSHLTSTSELLRHLSRPSLGAVSLSELFFGSPEDQFLVGRQLLNTLKVLIVFKVDTAVSVKLLSVLEPGVAVGHLSVGRAGPSGLMRLRIMVALGLVH